MFESYLMGNMGGASNKCFTDRNESSDMIFGCTSGSISDFVSIGVYDQGSIAHENNLCNHNYFSEYDPGNQCQGLSDKSSPLYKFVTNACIGKESCELKNYWSALPLGN